MCVTIICRLDIADEKGMADNTNNAQRATLVLDIALFPIRKKINIIVITIRVINPDYMIEFIYRYIDAIDSLGNSCDFRKTYLRIIIANTGILMYLMLFLTTGFF